MLDDGDTDTVQVVGMMGHQDIAAKCQHINFGLVLGMSSRKG